MMVGLLVFALFFVSAEIGSSEMNFENLKCSDLLQFKSDVVGQTIPSQIPYSNERFNIYVSGEGFGSIIIEEDIVIDFSCELLEERTYDIYVESIQTITDILNSEAPLSILNEKLGSDEIEIKGATAGKKIKMFFTKIGLKILDWFM